MNTTTKTRVAAVQMVSGPVVADNLQEAGHWIAEAARQGAQLVALPEYFPLISGDEADKLGIREEEGNGPIQLFLPDCARRHGIWLIGGSVPLVADDANKVRNTCLAYGPDGSQLARYDKIHLFAFTRGSERYDEARTIEAGCEPVAIDTPFGRVGLSICYDLRFPELYRQLSAAGAEVIVAPSAFTYTTGTAHWHILTRARAIENLATVIAPNQAGHHASGRRTYGHSLICDSWGQITSEARSDANEIVIADIDRGRAARIREGFPCLSHRRLG